MRVLIEQQVLLGLWLGYAAGWGCDPIRIAEQHTWPFTKPATAAPAAAAPAAAAAMIWVTTAQHVLKAFAWAMLLGKVPRDTISIKGKPHTPGPPPPKPLLLPQPLLPP
jgi:hypothetical protein